MKTHYTNEKRPAQTINALVLDDDDFDRRRLCRMSAASGLEMNVVSVPTIAKMRNALDTNVFDLFFLDYRLSNETGLDALAHIQGHGTNATAAKIMLTGHLKLDVAVTALKNGCDDYVSKDELSPVVLRRTVESVLAKTQHRFSSVTTKEDMIDQALYNLAVTRLPVLLAEVLSTPAVQQVIAPLLHTAIEEGIALSLARYDLPQSALADPQVRSLIGTLTDDHQIRLNV